MRLAREFKRPDWRRMLSEISSSELSEWFGFFREHYFSDVLLDAEFSTLQSTVLALVTGTVKDADYFSLLSPPLPEDRTDDELMTMGEGIFGGVRYGPAN